MSVRDTDDMRIVGEKCPVRKLEWINFMNNVTYRHPTSIAKHTYPWFRSNTFWSCKYHYLNPKSFFKSAITEWLFLARKTQNLDQKCFDSCIFFTKSCVSKTSSFLDQIYMVVDKHELSNRNINAETCDIARCHLFWNHPYAKGKKAMILYWQTGATLC